jgi:hypothetical protein
MEDSGLIDPIQELETLQYTLQLRWHKEDMKYILARNYWHYRNAVDWDPLVLEKFAMHSAVNGQWRVVD